VRPNSFFGLLATAAVAFVLGSCSTLGPNDNPTVPPNYRQLLAANLSEKTDFSKFIKAEISPPGVWESPLNASASRPIACARVTVEGTFGPHTYALGYLFLNGKIEDVFSPDAVNPALGGAFAAALKNSVTCGKLSYGPFPELARPKKQTAGR